MMPGEQDLGGLAGKQAKRRDVADRVAGEECDERVAQWKGGPAEAGSHGRWQAPPPALSPDEKAEAGQGEDENEAPADAPDGLDNLGNSRAPHRVGKERCAGQGGGDRDEVLAA